MNILTKFNATKNRYAGPREKHDLTFDYEADQAKAVFDAAIEATTTVTAGTGVTATTGGVTASAGNIVATLGNITASAGSVAAATTVTGGTGVTATTGDVVATAGAVNAGTTVTAGTGITSTTGAITATAGAVVAGTTVTGGTGVIATTGNITASVGNFVKTGLYGSGTSINMACYEANMATASGTGTATITISPGIPANSIVLGVTSFIDTILAGSGLTTWILGVTGDTDRYHTPTIAVAANTATSSLSAGATGYLAPHLQVAAINILMTADAGVFSTGIIHICVHYITITGPTT